MMQKKIASILAVALLWVGLFSVSVPRAQAFHVAGSDSWTLTGTVVGSFSDPRLGPITAAGREGQPVTVTAIITTSSAAGQLPLILGVKFDWMTAWANSSVVNVQPNQQVVMTNAVTIPALAGPTAGLNLVLHDWEARIWNSDGTAKVTTNACSDASTPPCEGSGTQSRFAIYSNDQADGVLARIDAQAKASLLSATLSGLNQLPPGGAKASADLGSANAELSLGDTSYRAGNFGAARIHYQNALNMANSASAALGAGESGTYFGSWFSGVGWLLGGVAALLLSLGGFRYLGRRKPS